ncbi:SCP2 domain-containing protein [Corallincola platygyrae]|uniref:Ubiquinone biosynthesis accessory factor UbiJ n=1 Tax=Corallincola platygyrae TaxID=1193278 RepID=A0ABW4XNN9_9GAMM
MPVTPLLVGGLEALLNRYLQSAPNHQNLLASLRGKRLRLELAELPAPLLFAFSDSRIDLMSGEQSDWDCRLQLAAIDLPKLQTGSDLSELIKSDRLVLEGNAEIAQQFAALLKGLEVDWQEPLSKWIGDPATHMLSQLLARGKQYANRQKEEGMAQLGRMLTDEVALVAHPLALAAFADDVQLLAADTDAVEVRLKRLETKTQEQGA